LYFIKWDKKHNGIELSNKIKETEKITPPRPVYPNELDLFGFDEFWEYDRIDIPLLWAIGRNYYYYGELVATLTGGDIFNSPKKHITKNIKLEPIEINKVVEINNKSLVTLETEAKNFINKLYHKNKKNHSIGVAYSGGKDSQVILDLISQVIPPDEYFSIFTDTQMELPSTYQLIKNTEKLYKKKFDKFRLYIARQNNPIITNWRYFGTPSRLQRWCCSVCKTIPYLKLIHELNPDNKSVIVFEGIRREESSRRKAYERIAYGKKHNVITSARPIFDWNLTEIYLYLLYRNIDINIAYKYGLTRVGCMVCPFSSEWSEYIINKLYPKMTRTFLNTIYESLPIIGVNSKKQKEEYVQKGNWKKRAGGKCLLPMECSYDIVDTCENIEIDLRNPNSNFFEWIKILKPTIKQISKFEYLIDAIYNKEYYQLNIIEKDYGIYIKYVKKNSNQIFSSILKKIAYKTTFCIKCGACEIECPNSAIKMNPKIEIDINRCSSCLNCITFVDKGCLLAKSRHGVIGGSVMSDTKVNFDRYSTFGFREEWIINIFNSQQNWKQGLGSKQIPAFRRWLIEAELFNEKNKVQKIFLILRDKTLNIVWPILWNNLCINSPIVKWYSNLEFTLWSRKNLNEKIFSQYPQYSEGTLKNSIAALLNTFNNVTNYN